MTNLTINLVAADGATGSVTATLPTINSTLYNYSLYSASSVPPEPTVPFSGPITLGMNFSVDTAGQISAIKFYNEFVGAFEVGLWDGATLLASANYTSTTPGWQTVPLASPVSVAAGTTYTAGYFSATANQFARAYANDLPNGFTSSVTVGPITVPADGGFYDNSGAFARPTSIASPPPWNTSDYYVDVVFQCTTPPPPPPPMGALHFGMFGQSTAADYAATEQQFGMAAGSMWLSGPGLAFDTWANYTGSAYSAAQLAMQQGRSKIFINVPPVISGATLTQAAAGDFNTYYAQAAGQFNNAAFDTVVFRCIWEWQGGWYPWGWSSGQQNQSTYVTDFIGAFQQMVTTIRANMGNVKNVQFCLSGAQGDQVQMPNWQACYPGDAYVDWIGVDWYDGNPGDNTGTDLASEQARWAQDNAPGASTCFQLCTAHKKGFAIPEWSVGKCGDDPYFVDQVRATLQAVQNAGLPVFSGYWRAPYGGVNGDYNLYPNTLARMLADFPGNQSS